MTSSGAARAFSIGVSGTRESGRTQLLLAMCRLLRDNYSLAVLTTQSPPDQDGCREFLLRHKALAPARIALVLDEDDPDFAFDALMTEFRPELAFLDREANNGDWIDALAHYRVHVVDGSDRLSADDVIDVVNADLLVINQTRLGLALDVQPTPALRDCLTVRGDAPCVFTQARHGVGTIAVARHFLECWRRMSAPAAWSEVAEERPLLTPV
jgi:urease accessory protein